MCADRCKDGRERHDRLGKDMRRAGVTGLTSLDNRISDALPHRTCYVEVPFVARNKSSCAGSRADMVVYARDTCVILIEYKTTIISDATPARYRKQTVNCYNNFIAYIHSPTSAGYRRSNGAPVRLYSILVIDRIGADDETSFSGGEQGVNIPAMYYDNLFDDAVSKYKRYARSYSARGRKRGRKPGMR